LDSRFQPQGYISQYFEKLPDFEKLPPMSKAIHPASICCITLLMAPAAYHRFVFADQDAEEMHRIARRFITCVTVPLAFGLAGDVCVVLAEISASAAIGPLLLATGVLVFLIGVWHASLSSASGNAFAGLV
jgi:Family of unknown function (DUF6328)